jgi:integrase/recombinase XerD
LTDCSIDRVIKQAGKVAEVRSEIRVSAHTFRHWYAQTQLKNGLDIYSLSRVLGHESVNITRIYLQGVQDDEIIKSSIKTSPLMNLKVR